MAGDLMSFKDVTVKEIENGTYMLTDLFNDHFYLLVGKQKALLIDGGIGNLSVPRLIREMTDKPVVHALTHGHLDHLGCVGMFKETYISYKDISLFQRHIQNRLIKRKFIEAKFLKYGNELSEAEKKGYTEALLEQETETVLLDLPDQFDLGERIVKVISVPGHTQGSTVFYDECSEYLFSGDSICDMGILLHFEESCSVEEYASALKDLKQYPLTGIGNGHHRGLIGPEYLSKYLALCAIVLDSDRSQDVYHYEDISIRTGPRQSSTFL